MLLAGTGIRVPSWLTATLRPDHPDDYSGWTFTVTLRIRISQSDQRPVVHRFEVARGWRFRQDKRVFDAPKAFDPNVTEPDLGDEIADVVANLDHYVDAAVRLLVHVQTDDPDAATAAGRVVRKAQRRRNVSDATLRMVADVYREAVDNNEPTARAIVKAMDYPITESYARKLVLLARAAGHLPKTRPGRALS